jgi:hypothetical protein
MAVTGVLTIVARVRLRVGGSGVVVAVVGGWMVLRRGHGCAGDVGSWCAGVRVLRSGRGAGRWGDGGRVPRSYG